jgi:polar amino acid transport system substrate-binding protein
VTLSRRFATRTAGAAVLLGLVGLLTSCAPQEENGSAATTSGSSTTGSNCTKDGLKFHTEGKLTVATDKPAYAPWFIDDDPSNGKGYESAVAYKVAEKLGFAKSDVVWVTASFNSVIQPGPKPFDFDINQVSITDERKKNIDMTTGYYDITQAVVAVKGTKGGNAKTLADLKGLKIGAQQGTTAMNAIAGVIKPTPRGAIYNTTEDAIQGLQNQQIDALVVDFPSAEYMASAQLKNGVVVGQIPRVFATAEQFGLVLDKGSPLTSCLSTIVDEIRINGDLDTFEKQYLATKDAAPFLKAS